MKKSFIVLVASILFLLSCHTQNEERKSKTITIGFVGDILLDRGVRKQMEREGKEAFYAAVKEHLPKVDYLVGNLECPVTSIQQPVFKQFVFRGDTSNFPYLKALGFTHLTMANNHSYDQGRAGMVSTAEGIEQHGMTPLGYGTTKATACDPVFIDAKGQKIILLASVFLALENWMPLDDFPNICQADYLVLGAQIKTLKTQFPKSKIVVNLHWGLEHQPKPTMQQKKQAHHLVDSGADLVIGHHPHVIQAPEMYRGKSIYYSLGNFIFDQKKEINRKGMVVQAAANYELKITNYEFEITNGM